eukprot:5154536-Pyramimonas_sp.AAC.2
MFVLETTQQRAGRLDCLQVSQICTRGSSQIGVVAKQVATASVLAGHVLPRWSKHNLCKAGMLGAPDFLLLGRCGGGSLRTMRHVGRKSETLIVYWTMTGKCTCYSFRELSGGSAVQAVRSPNAV